MPLLTRPVRPLALPVALLLATALMTAGLTGCSAMSPFSTCDDTAARLKDLRSQSILNSVPEGATAPEGLNSVHSRCIDDTVDAWL
ncbi:hypothetical protein ACIHCM_35205 [Streptomyces sp. NPDC052023]|uniref:hypothetical protein n=1 Tax=Streptomyces sp. NPDC052023 TaxID=3365681 RepID=UPI0037D1E0EA